jgi:murein DD-endopeptidase / murein LD-carboxypeptidase
MYQKILLLALICSSILPANASSNLDNDLTSQDINTIATEAKSWKGTPYRYGGKDKKGIDCSHFVYAVYNRIFEGYDYRMANEYLNDSTFALTKSPLAGDVIVFPAVRGLSEHVGIITDVNAPKFIGAQSSTGVKETSFAPGSYWGKRPYKIVSLLPDE